MSSLARLLALAASILLAIGVQLGALGAHALRSILTPDQLNSWALAVQYQLIHGLGILLIVLLGRWIGPSRWLNWAGGVMLAGIFLFSGSIYMALLGPRWFGMVAPLGGTSFMVAWLLLAVAIWKHESNS